MSTFKMAVKSISTSVRYEEPKYASALVVFVVDGIEIPISVPLKQKPETDLNAYEQMDIFFQSASLIFSDSLRKLKDDLKKQ